MTSLHAQIRERAAHNVALRREAMGLSPRTGTPLAPSGPRMQSAESATADTSTLPATPAPAQLTNAQLVGFYRAQSDAIRPALDAVNALGFRPIAIIGQLGAATTAMCALVVAGLESSFGLAPTTSLQAALVFGATAALGLAVDHGLPLSKRETRHVRKALAVAPEYAAAVRGAVLETLAYPVKPGRVADTAAYSDLKSSVRLGRLDAVELHAQLELLAAIAADAHVIERAGFSDRHNGQAIVANLAKLPAEVARDVASSIALQLYRGPDGSYAPRFEIAKNAPTHLERELKSALFALVPAPREARSVHALVFSEKVWVRAGETIFIEGRGHCVYEGNNIVRATTGQAHYLERGDRFYFNYSSCRW